MGKSEKSPLDKYVQNNNIQGGGALCAFLLFEW